MLIKLITKICLSKSTSFKNLKTSSGIPTMAQIKQSSLSSAKYHKTYYYYLIKGILLFYYRLIFASILFVYTVFLNY